MRNIEGKKGVLKWLLLDIVRPAIPLFTPLTAPFFAFAACLTSRPYTLTHTLLSSSSYRYPLFTKFLTRGWGIFFLLLFDLRLRLSFLSLFAPHQQIPHLPHWRWRRSGGGISPSFALSPPLKEDSEQRREAARERGRETGRVLILMTPPPSPFHSANSRKRREQYSTRSDSWSWNGKGRYVTIYIFLVQFWRGNV